MRLSLLRALWAAPILLVAACNPFEPSATAPVRSVDAGAVKTAVETYAAKLNARDAAGAAEVYANDPAFHWVENGRVAYTTRDAAAKALSDFLTGFPDSRIEVRSIRIDPVGDQEAIATVDFRQTVAANGQTAYAYDGVMTLAMVERDGAWRIIVGHSSTGQLPR